MRPFQGLSYSFMHTLFLLHVYDHAVYVQYLTFCILEARHSVIV